MNHRRPSPAALAVLALLALKTPGASTAQTPACQALLPAGLSFPSIDSDLPLDATFGTGPGSQLSTQKGFDLFSWKSFVALNWPAANDGTPLAASILANPTKAPRVWETYITAGQIFKPDGAQPDRWPTNDLAEGRLLTSVSKNVLADVNTAGFPGTSHELLPPVADANGNYLFYEIYVNKVEYDYIVGNNLYFQNGQTAFLANPANAVDFPKGSNPSGKAAGARGSIELKAAWKRMGTGDDPSRFYTIRPTVIDPVTHGVNTGRTYGLIGLHIVTRTASAPQWIWSTFEHVDNAPDVGTPAAALASHYNLNDPAKPQPNARGYVNKPASSDPVAEPTTPTQVARVAQPGPVAPAENDFVNDPWTKCLNATMQDKLKGTVWANYRLVTTQWPDMPVNQGSTFSPFPTRVANTSMETYLQRISCMDCHIGALTSGQRPGGQPDDANFSFLLKKAQPRR
jgi:hypothetical protein